MKKKGVFKAIIIIFLLFLIGFTSFLGFYFFNMRDLDFMLGRLKINESSKVSYSVNLKDEDFRKDSKAKQYVTNLIKVVKPSFNYNAAFNEDVVGDYSYTIAGRLEIEDEDGKVLVNRNIYSNEGITNNIDGRVINMSSSFDIRFDEYKNMYDDLVKEYNIKLKGNLVFDINIKYDVFNETIAKDVTSDEHLMITIPLGNETTEVLIPDETSVKRIEYSDAENEYTSIYFIISMEFFGSTILFILVLILIVKHFYGNLSKYDKELAKIISKYKGRLVKIKDLPDLTKYDVLFVDDITSLDDASINIMSPINYVEVIKDCEAVFIVFKDNQAYVYKLSKEIESTD